MKKTVISTKTLRRHSEMR